MRVLCIGESLLEISCPVNTQITDGSNLFITEKQENGGGHAGNVAYLLGKWGVETYIASMMGADDIANKIKKEYESVGVKTDYIETSFDRGTSINVALINQSTKTNTVIEVNNNSKLKKYSFLIEPDIIFSDGNDFNASVSATDKFTKATSVLKISRFTNEIIELCRYYKYIIFNKKSAEDFTGMNIDFKNTGTIVNLYNKIKQKYPSSEIVITLGEKGCVYSDGSQIKVMPPVSVNVVDNNGAGDIFAGAFVYGIGRNFEYEKTITYATIASSLSAARFSSRQSIPALSEISGYYDGRNSNIKVQSAGKKEKESNTVNMNTVQNNQETTVNMNTTSEQNADNGNTGQNTQA